MNNIENAYDIPQLNAEINRLREENNRLKDEVAAQKALIKAFGIGRELSPYERAMEDIAERLRRGEGKLR